MLCQQCAQLRAHLAVVIGDALCQLLDDWAYLQSKAKR